MLVTFKTQAYADISMFGTIATRLLKMMGQSGNVPGAIMAEDLPAAREALQQALAELPEDVRENQEADEDDDPDAPPPSIGLATRAQPLLELLDAAIAAGVSVSWQE